MNKIYLVRYCPKVLLKVIIRILCVKLRKDTQRKSRNGNGRIHPLKIKDGWYDLHPSDWMGSFPGMHDFSRRNRRRYAIAFGLGDKEVSSWDELEASIGFDHCGDKDISDRLFEEIAEKLGLSQIKPEDGWEIIGKKLGIDKIVAVCQIIDVFCEKEYGTSVQTEGYE